MSTTTLSKTEAKQFLKPDSDENKAINAFLNGQVGKFGQYYALPNALVHRILDINYMANASEVKQSVVAMNLNGNKIGNSSIVKTIGARKSFGEYSFNIKVTSIQEKLSTLIPMIPYNVFDEAQLDIRKLCIVEKLGDESLTVRVDNPKYDAYGTTKQKNEPEHLIETRHFTGACLFEVENKYFLFDIDREEIKHKLFNAFLVQIPVPVKTVKDAYRALKPIDVTIAEWQGLEVVRQGEWFFIPVKGDHKPDTEVSRWGNTEAQRVNKRMELRAGDNRPNHAEQGVEKLSLVQGKVEHSGREHRTINLVGWHKAIPNTGVKSFTIVGDVD